MDTWLILEVLKFTLGVSKAFAQRRSLAFEGEVNISINNLRDDLEQQIADAVAGGEVDLSNYYTQYEVNQLLNQKADTSHSHNITDVYTLQSQLSDKVGIYDTSLYYYYTKTTIDNKLSTLESDLREAIDQASAGGDIDLSNYYTKSQIDGFLSSKANVNHTHSNYALNGHMHSISDISGLSDRLDAIESGSGGGKAAVLIDTVDVNMTVDKDDELSVFPIICGEYDEFGDPSRIDFIKIISPALRQEKVVNGSPELEYVVTPDPINVSIDRRGSAEHNFSLQINTRRRLRSSSDAGPLFVVNAEFNFQNMAMDDNPLEFSLSCSDGFSVFNLSESSADLAYFRFTCELYQYQ